MNTQTEAERLAGALAVLATWRDDSTGTLEQSAAELRRLSQHEIAHNQWLEKTKWVQDTAQPGDLGKHYADVIKTRIEAMQEEIHEQCRINGMGAEREAKLMAEKDELLKALHLIRDVSGGAAVAIAEAAIAKHSEDQA